MDARALSGDASDADAAAVLADDALDDRQPQPGAGVFGGEEGLEEMRQIMGAMPVPLSATVTRSSAPCA